MRDLKADLREWNSDLINGIRSTDWFYLAGEYIERAIKAEEELEKQQQLFEAQTGRNVEIIKRLNERKREVCEANAALREENDLQRHSIQQLSAQVAAYRKVIIDCPIEAQDGCNCPDCKAVGNCENILYTQPDPGAEIRERLAKLEAVAEAAWGIKEYLSNNDNCKCAWCGISKTLRQALAALEGPAHE